MRTAGLRLAELLHYWSRLRYERCQRREWWEDRRREERLQLARAGVLRFPPFH